MDDIRFQQANAAFQAGRFRDAVDLLDSLLHAHTVPPEHERAVRYSHAVALLAVGDLALAAQLLEELRTSIQGDEGDAGMSASIALELSAAYTRLGKLPQGLHEAEVALASAPAVSSIAVLALQNKGIVERLFHDNAAAGETFSRGIEIACELRMLPEAGILAEQIARARFGAGHYAAAHAWATLAVEIASKHAPHNVATANSLLAVTVGIGSPNDAGNDSQLIARVRQLDTQTQIRMDVSALDVLDVDLYLFLIASIDPAPTGTIVPLYKVPEIKASLMKRICAEIEAVRGDELYPRVLLETCLARELHVSETMLPFPPGQCYNRFQAYPEDAADPAGLVWESESPWPAGLAFRLVQLVYLFAGAFLTTRRRMVESNSDSLLTLTARTWPRRFAARMLALGAYESGSVPVPGHIVDELAARNAADHERNVRAFERMGYIRADARDLTAGGMIALLASEVADVAIASGKRGGPTFGGIPIDEYNVANLPNLIGVPAAERKDGMPGFFLDRHYQAPFVARKLGTQALYGARNNLFRDHFTALHERHRAWGSVRCKHFAVPIYEIACPEDARRIVADVPIHSDMPLQFRGQAKLYSLGRPPALKRLLFGGDDVVEPSLLGAAPRRALDYDRVHSVLHVAVQDELYRRAADAGANRDEVHERWKTFAEQPSCAWDREIMALAQHYGIPTNGIDVTESLDVALWFATNIFSTGPDGCARYTTMRPEHWRESADDWPVVFVVQTVATSLRTSIQRIANLEELGIVARRPERQAANLFMGAHTIHDNRLAEALVCILRLRPGAYEVAADFATLFPPPSDDPAYRLMLELKDRFCDSSLGSFFREIAMYDHGAGIR